jgi:hypothetical protein
MESVHLVVFLLLCLDNQQQSFSSSKFLLKRQKETNTQSKNIKKAKEKYMIQGIPGFLLEESLFKVISLTVASSLLVCRGRGCISAILWFIIFINLIFNHISNPVVLESLAIYFECSLS